MKVTFQLLILCVLGLIAQGQPASNADGLVASMTSRQTSLEQFLLSKQVYETAGGMVAANRHRGLPTEEVEKLVAAENSDRQALYKQMAEKAGGGQTWQDVGHERMNRYTTRLTPGILREDPRSRLLVDSWPAPILTVEDTLRLCFSKLDLREQSIRSGDSGVSRPTESTEWENAGSIIERMQQRLPTLVDLLEKKMVIEGEDGFVIGGSPSLSSEQQRLVAIENSDRRELYQMITLQANDPGITMAAVGTARAKMKKSPTR